MVGQCANRLVRVTVGKGRSFKGWPFVVSGEWQFEDGPDGVVCRDRDLVNHGLEQCLASVVGLVHEDVPDFCADLGEVGREFGLPARSAFD
jgi:hypothetical protein